MRRLLLSMTLLSMMPVATKASQPGQPLDCSDMVFSEPGHACTVFAALGSFPQGQQYDGEPSSNFLDKGANLQVDNTGRMFALRLSTGGHAKPGPQYLGAVELRRYDGQGQVVVAYILDRVGQALSGENDHVRPTNSYCNGGANNCSTTENYFSQTLTFDSINGRFLIPLQSYCLTDQGNDCPAGYGGGWWIAAIDGFPKLFDIFQTYTPVAGGLTFTVPAMPEGLASADYFDTYWGNVASLPDFTQAQPMACGYPASPPAVGDFLTVADTSPTPLVGQANYIVTAVTHGSERRFGRQLVGPTMTGRNPAPLPACVQQ